MGDKCVTYAEELDLLPTAVGFMWDNVFRHEVVGRWWYWIFQVDFALQKWLVR